MSNTLHLSDVIRGVREKSHLARDNANVALALVWREYGVKITDEQLIAIQQVDRIMKPQTFAREWGRQNKLGTPEVSSDKPLVAVLEETPIRPPRKKILGFF